MPTNLPPEALAAERQYRAAETAQDKITYLQEYLSLIPKHKGTDRLRGDLRKRLSKLQDTAQKSKGKGKTDSPYRIDREGAGQVAVVGLTNVGKSALVAVLTSASPEVSPSPYTTWQPTPGMMAYEDVPIQLIDTPPLNPDYVENEMMDMIRRLDLVLLVVDLQTEPVRQLEGAIAILEAHHIVPAHWRDHYESERRIFYVPMLVLANRCDGEGDLELYELFRELVDEAWPMLPVSAETGLGLDELRKQVFDRLGVIRIYSKPPNKPADMTAPYVVPQGSTIEDLAGKVHKDFIENLKAARVWGSASFDGQMVGRDHVLEDRDVVELRM